LAAQAKLADGDKALRTKQSALDATKGSLWKVKDRRQRAV
jgi:hypothetical protein